MSDWNAEPLYFGPASRPLFGWLHRASSALAQTDIGLVLCNPFGFDAISSHRTIRHLAQTASSMGMNAMRFDYDGTGDSAGDEFDEDRVGAWIRSIHAAADELKVRCGAQRIALLGIRLGALLASAAAAQRQDVAGIALILPVVKARAYLREIRALHTAVVNPRPEDLGDGDSTLTESIGFLMTGQTVAALEALGGIDAGRLPAGEVLILDRADLPSARALADALRDHGVRIRYATTPDQELLLRSPSATQLSADIFGSCTAWMTNQLAARDHGASAAGGHQRAATGNVEAVADFPGGDTAAGETVGTVTEVAACADPGRLFSITTLPGAEASSAHTRPRRGILLLNSGAVHHIGPSRLYVTMARRWAREGYVVMRLDLAGIGDSPAPAGEQENVIYPDHAADNVGKAVTMLRDRYGVEQIVSLGLCSGAYHSFLAARLGMPLSGVVLINPLTFYWVAGTPLDEGDFSPRTAAAALESERYRKSMFRLGTWRKLVRGEVDLKAFVSTVAHFGGARLRTGWRNLKRSCGVRLQNDLPSDMRRISERGVRPVILFGRGDLGLPRMRALGGGPLQRLIGRKRVVLHLIDDADHTFMQLKHRRMLQRLLSNVVHELLPDRDALERGRNK